MTNTKTCTKCKKELPITQFYKNSKEKDGHRFQCKKCHHYSRSEYVSKLKGNYLYLLCHDNHVMYVGSTLNLYNRLFGHKFYKVGIINNCHCVNNIKVYGFKDITRKELLAVEQIAIDKFKPFKNKRRSFPYTIPEDFLNMYESKLNSMEPTTINLQDNLAASIRNLEVS